MSDNDLAMAYDEYTQMYETGQPPNGMAHQLEAEYKQAYHIKEVASETVMRYVAEEMARRYLRRLPKHHQEKRDG